MAGVMLTGASLLQAGETKFWFGETSPQPGFALVTSQTQYDAKAGFGFADPAPEQADAPRRFLVDVGEGNYDVTVRFGAEHHATSSTIKAESRRLMLEKVETKAGEFITRTFTVNVRRPAISTGGIASLNAREKGPPMSPDWDEHLTLELSGLKPGVVSIEIKPNPTAVTVFIAGDSTVTDQANEPYTGWGQMLPRFFEPGVAVSNHAESGLALFSFRGQKRLDKVLSMMKKGDYLFIQFGHNDQKDKGKDAGPYTTYKANLKKFIDAVREKGGIPVVISPMERRRWKDGKPEATLADFAEAARQVGWQENAPIIDLNAMSLQFYAKLGEQDSTKAFVFYPANTYPGQDKDLKDNTHHSGYGAYELARCVVEAIKANVPDLAKHLTSDAGTFDPSNPDPAESFHIPLTPPLGKVEKPAGN
jgi:lysophospholipase L1-like esterase